MSAKAARRSPRKKPSRPRATRLFQLHGSEESSSPWARIASALVIALGAAGLVVAAVLHRVGDYSAETDFYGSYVAGAKLFQAGHPDPSLYRATGPLYDLLLGLTEWLVRDFFTAAKLIAVASAAGTWLVWRAMLRERVGEVAALWATAFLVVNPTFFQYGHSVVSHETAVCLESLALLLLLRARRGPAVFWSGAVAGAAALTRYPAMLLLPAAWMTFWILDRGAWPSRWRSAALHLAGFLVVVLPWMGFSIGRGQVPAEALVSRASFYLGPTSQNVQDAPGAFGGASPDQGVESLAKVVTRDPLAFLSQAARGLGEHLVRDLRDLVGIPVAVLVLLGLSLAIWDRARALLPLYAPWLLHTLALAPVFYSAVYRLPLLPGYMALAGVAIGSRKLALRVSGVPLKPCLALVPLVLSTLGAVTTSRAALDQMPIEVREAGRTLATLVTPGERVMARKGHIGYYSGLPVVAFPRVATLADLARSCRENQVRWIYFSWYEALLRQEFLYLLDTTAVIPGLKLVHSTDEHPSRLYRVESGFGADPTWWADPAERNIHIARGAVQVLEDPYAWRYHLILGGEAAGRGDMSAMLEHADAALRGRPDEPNAWALRGGALQGMGRDAEARAAYQTALSLSPGLPTALWGLRQLH